VKQVESLPIGHVFIGIKNLDFRDQPGALQCERCARTDPSTPANDSNFHLLLLSGDDLISDRLNECLCLGIGVGYRLSARSFTVWYGTCDPGPPFVVVT